ncbi:flavin-containing monooxygenase [Siccirubricoccus deserti]
MTAPHGDDAAARLRPAKASGPIGPRSETNGSPGATQADAGVQADTCYDAIIIGAGIAGLYQLYRLRELGLSVRVFETGSGVGGTWYWNRYPGARFDSESYTYGYSFSDALLQEWSWSEHFAAQPETLRYLNHVADRFDLRRNIQCNSRVTAARFDEAARRWEVTLESGERHAARFLITALGPLGRYAAAAAGVESFRGESFHTYRWPHYPVDFAGKRVAVIGTGATGVQIIQTIATLVGHLTVFQRTPIGARRCTTARSPRRSSGRSRAATPSSSICCARRPAATSTTPIRAAPSRSRRRSARPSGSSATASPASASGRPISATSSPTPRRMR